jgi:hypothetical protein
MPLIFDKKLHYDGYHGCDSVCRVRAYNHAGQTVIVCSELEENEGTSITNMAEHLCYTMREALGWPAPWIWIEHYPDTADLLLPSSFSLVTFVERPGRFRPHHDRNGRVYECSCGVLSNPKWTYTTRANVETLTGVEWPRTEEG